MNCACSSWPPFEIGGNGGGAEGVDHDAQQGGFLVGYTCVKCHRAGRVRAGPTLEAL